MQLVKADVLVCGDSLGGCAAAMRLAKMGRSVVMLMEHPWPGGQMTSQAVPPDEHPWIESFGRTELYAEYRRRVRREVKSRGVTPQALGDPLLNPGGGWVSRLCHEPEVGARVLRAMMEESGPITKLPGPATRAEVAGDRVVAVEAGEWRIEAPMVLDATELGDILKLAGAESVVGAESRRDTGEPHALEGEADPTCQQPITWCAVFAWEPGKDFRGAKPDDYDQWRAWQPPYWPGPLFSFDFPNVRTGETQNLPLFGEQEWQLFSYRQIVNPALWTEPRPAATVVNWPQNDMMEGSLLLSEEEKERTLARARSLTLSVLHWLQTECGAEGMRLAPELSGTADGLAQAAYIRESRRALTLKRLTELEVSAEVHPGRDRALPIEDSVGVGAYRIDLHPRINGMPTLDLSSVPYQIPLGSLVPVRMENLIPACKNIGVTHIANGCTRLHPVEWGIGEAAAVLAAWCLTERLTPQQAAAAPGPIVDLQSEMVRQGLELAWPERVELKAL